MATPPSAPIQQPTPTGTTPPTKRRLVWGLLIVLIAIVGYNSFFAPRPRPEQVKTHESGKDEPASEEQIAATRQAQAAEVEQEKMRREREDARKAASHTTEAITKTAHDQPTRQARSSGGGTGYSHAKKSAPSIVFDVRSERREDQSAASVLPAAYRAGEAAEPQDPMARARAIRDQSARDYQHRLVSDTPDGYAGSAPTQPAMAAREERRPDLLKPDPSWPTTVLPEGTVIECALKNQLEGENDGPVEVMVTSDVYQRGTHNLVLPQGTVVEGETKRVSMLNQERIAVLFHRAILELSDGTLYGVSLHDPALDENGAVALHDKVNHHYLQIFGASLAVGAIGGLANIGNSYGGVNGYDTLSSIRTGIGSEMAMSAQRIMTFYLNRLPTITIRAGHPVRIMLTGDLSVPLYPEPREATE